MSEPTSSHHTQSPSQINTIITTVVITTLVLVVAGAVIISRYGVETVSNEVSPFVENTQNRLTEGVVPPSERSEPKTDADLIMEAVAGSQGSAVLIYRTDQASSSNLVGRGLLVSTDGMILTDQAAIVPSAQYEVAIPGERNRIPVRSLAPIDEAFTLLRITHNTSLVPRFGENTAAVGDLVVAVTGTESMSIATGIVTAVEADAVRTNLVGTIAPGSVLVSKEGQVVGLSTVAAQDGQAASFTPLTRTFITDLRNNANAISTEL